MDKDIVNDMKIELKVKYLIQSTHLHAVNYLTRNADENTTHKKFFTTADVSTQKTRVILGVTIKNQWKHFNKCERNKAETTKRSENTTNLSNCILEEIDIGDKLVHRFPPIPLFINYVTLSRPLTNRVYCIDLQT